MVQFRTSSSATTSARTSAPPRGQRCVACPEAQRPRQRRKTARHHTFFEMLGNFSFGDYFKRRDDHLRVGAADEGVRHPRERLVVTVFRGEEGSSADDEARARSGARSPASPTSASSGWARRTTSDDGRHGPQRPVHRPSTTSWATGARLARFDQESPDGASGWMEIWNLVFMQFNRAGEGQTTDPLPGAVRGHGMPASSASPRCIQGVMTNYDTDLLCPLVDRRRGVGGSPTAGMATPTTSRAVIADHARMAASSRSPRASRLQQRSRRRAPLGDAPGDSLRLRAVKEPSFHRSSPARWSYGAACPELVQHRDFIVEQARLEDVRFRETRSRRGSRLLGSSRTGRRTTWAFACCRRPGSSTTYGFPHRPHRGDRRGAASPSTTGLPHRAGLPRRSHRRGRARRSAQTSTEGAPSEMEASCSTMGAGDDRIDDRRRVRRSVTGSCLSWWAWWSPPTFRGDQETTVEGSGRAGATSTGTASTIGEGETGEVIARPPFTARPAARWRRRRDRGGGRLRGGRHAEARGTLSRTGGRSRRRDPAGDGAAVVTARRGRRRGATTARRTWPTGRCASAGSHAQQKGSRAPDASASTTRPAERSLRPRRSPASKTSSTARCSPTRRRPHRRRRKPRRGRGRDDDLRKKYGDSVRMLTSGRRASSSAAARTSRAPATSGCSRWSPTPRRRH